MKFSYEEIYLHFGQFDRFVSLDFERNTEAYNIRPSLMGSFIYTYDERVKIQKQIEQPIETRTDARIKFQPSSLEKLSEEQIIHLDKNGIVCSEIRNITYYNAPAQNDFIQSGEKELKKMIIPFRTRGTDLFLLRLGLYRSRINSGYGLIPEEENEYRALDLFYYSNSEKEADEGSFVNPSVRFYFLNLRYYKGILIEKQEEEFFELLKERTVRKSDILLAEIDAAGINLVDLIKQNRETYTALVGTAIQFDDELLLPYEIPIWWDYERFLHIYIRHVKEMQAGNYVKEKTKFQYSLSDISMIVKNVIKQVYPEILQHFKDQPQKPFFRIGKRMPYYNGNYYRVDIEPGGRLIAFHPFNDNEEKV